MGRLGKRKVKERNDVIKLESQKLKKSETKVRQGRKRKYW